VDEEPRQLEAEIERTRTDLGNDVDALADKIRPSRIVERRVSRIKGSGSAIKDRFMGTVQEASSGVHDGATAPVDMVRQRTTGNPLAVGLIAFGVGWLSASLVPATDKEKMLASNLQDAARENAGPVMDELKSSGSQIAENLREPAKQAVSSVQETAGQAAQQVGDQVRGSTG
jgi:F0F1-type ATP synthase membrane subunit b/b'